MDESHNDSDPIAGSLVDFHEVLAPALQSLRESVENQRPMTWPNFRRLATRATRYPGPTELSLWRQVYDSYVRRT